MKETDIEKLANAISNSVADLIEANATTIGLVGTRIAGAITARDASGGHDATGGHVTSLTEAVMGITSGLTQVADAISDLASAVRESKE